LVAFKEPFANLFTQGMVLNEVFFRKPDAGRVEYFNPADVEIRLDATAQHRIAVLRSDGGEVESGGVRHMSKSKNNGVDPQALVDEFGADTARLFTMFAAPPEQTLSGPTRGCKALIGSSSVCGKQCMTMCRRVRPCPLDKAALNDGQRAIRRQAHQTLAKITDDIGRRRTFNTAIAAAMELLNALAKYPQRSAQDHSVMQEALEIAVLGLSPIIPHVTHAMWRALGHRTALIDEPWTPVDAAALQTSSIAMVVQVNGKAACPHHGAGRRRRGYGTGRGARRSPCAKFIGTCAVRKSSSCRLSSSTSWCNRAMDIVSTRRRILHRVGVRQVRQVRYARHLRRGRAIVAALGAALALTACAFVWQAAIHCRACSARPYLSLKDPYTDFSREFEHQLKNAGAAPQAVRANATATIDVTKDLVVQRTLSVSAQKYSHRVRTHVHGHFRRPGNDKELLAPQTISLSKDFRLVSRRIVMATSRAPFAP